MFCGWVISDSIDWLSLLSIIFSMTIFLFVFQIHDESFRSFNSKKIFNRNAAIYNNIYSYTLFSTYRRNEEYLTCIISGYIGNNTTDNKKA